MKTTTISVYLILCLSSILFMGCTKNTKSNNTPVSTDNGKLKSALEKGEITKDLYSEKSDIDIKREIEKGVDLSILKPGTVLRFGSSDPKSTSAEVKFNVDSSADITYYYRYAMNGNSDFIKERVTTAKYKMTYHDAVQVSTDNEKYPLIEKVIVLVNNDITREKGYLELGRSFCIGKSKSKAEPNSFPSISLYPWQDPLYYPRGGFYNFFSSLQLYEIDFVK